MKLTASVLNKRPEHYAEPDAPHSYFDEVDCKAYSLLVLDVIAKASKKGEEIGTSEIKARLGDRYSHRFALLDVIDFLGTIDARQKGGRQVYMMRERFVKPLMYQAHFTPEDIARRNSKEVTI